MSQFIFNTEIVRGASFSKSLRYSSVLCPSTFNATLQTGLVTFPAQTGLSVVVGQRVRASVLAPVEDPSIFIEGPTTAYNNGQLTFNVDTFAGAQGSIYPAWKLTAAIDLTGGSFDAVMRFNPASCAGRSRTPIIITVNVTGDPKTGVFSLYLSPAQTAILATGDYTYKVLFTPAASSDKLLVVSGTISVFDE